MSSRAACPSPSWREFGGDGLAQRVVAVADTAPALYVFKGDTFFSSVLFCFILRLRISYIFSCGCIICIICRSALCTAVYCTKCVSYVLFVRSKIPCVWCTWYLRRYCHQYVNCCNYISGQYGVTVCTPTCADVVNESRYFQMVETTHVFHSVNVLSWKCVIYPAFQDTPHLKLHYHVVRKRKDSLVTNMQIEVSLYISSEWWWAAGGREGRVPRSGSTDVSRSIHVQRASRSHY